MTVAVRPVVDEDLPALAAIYDHAIVHTDAIWLDEPIGPEAFAERIAPLRAAGHPVIVAVEGAGDGAQVVGYACYGPFRSLAGYAATVEHSVFVAPGHEGRGIGQRLLDELLARAAAEGRRTMVAAVDAANLGSIRFHERNGFVEVGRLPGVGTKHGRALDLVLLQRPLGEAAPR